MSTLQKSLSSLLSLCQKFSQSVKFDKVLIKNKFAQFFFETWCSVNNAVSCYTEAIQFSAAFVMPLFASF